MCDTTQAENKSLLDTIRATSCELVQCVACCSVLRSFAQCCTMLHNIAHCCSVLHMSPYVVVCCSSLQIPFVLLIADGCSVLQCVTVCCGVLHSVTMCCSVLQCVAVCCSVLQCVAVCCIVLQRVAVCCFAFQSVTVSLPPLSFSLFLTICLSLSHTHAYRRK